jgi:hypothetical protein
MILNTCCKAPRYTGNSFVFTFFMLKAIYVLTLTKKGLAKFWVIFFTNSDSHARVQNFMPRYVSVCSRLQACVSITVPGESTPLLLIFIRIVTEEEVSSALSCKQRRAIIGAGHFVRKNLVRILFVLRGK